MSGKNDLLNEEIESQLKEARNEPSEEEKEKPNIFYTVVIVIMSMIMIGSLLRVLF